VWFLSWAWFEYLSDAARSQVPIRSILCAE
jgi:hypothetical protein